VSDKAGCVLSDKAQVCFYPDWCKRCGNCVAFCPRKALAADEWGHPYLPDPERCTGCGLCEMLCPDFAITVGDAGSGREVPPPTSAKELAANAAAVSPGEAPPVKTSPERLAPAPRREEK
jgi:2-oxoglutarate ferredoxin oxidoreductase subunit delta